MWSVFNAMTPTRYETLSTPSSANQSMQKVQSPDWTLFYALQIFLMWAVAYLIIGIFLAGI
jgi:hypothetical protein